MRALQRLWRASIWDQAAIDADELKFAPLKRFFLPLYDIIAMCAGLFAVTHGSRLLNRILGSPLADAAGWTFLTVAAVCFVGVAFPRLWPVEMAGKVLLVGMVVAYAAAILLYPGPRLPDEPLNYFISAVLILTLPLPLFRLTLLGREWEERREEQG